MTLREAWSTTNWSRMRDRDGFAIWTRRVDSERIFLAQRAGTPAPSVLTKTGFASSQEALLDAASKSAEIPTLEKLIK